MTQVSIGIVTVPEREDYLGRVTAGMAEHFGPLSDLVCAVSVHIDVDHEGVAKAKNDLLRRALETQADWFFLSEDDVVAQSPEAVTGYLAAAERSGWEHLAFAHHGPANDGPWGIEPNGAVEYYPAYVGAWCLYSRRSIETCGLFDEAFVNSWDHVEHTLRLSLAGFHPLPGENYQLCAADAVGSERWLSEIPESIENTSIPHTDQWRADRERGRRHWRETYPESYYLVFSR